MSSLFNWVIFALLFNLIEASPVCSYAEGKHLVCVVGNYTEYQLKRGLVSDNDETTSITLSNCRISDINYESFHRLPALRYLDLSKNKITGLKLGVLDEFTALTHLNLSHNYISNFPLGIFDQKPNLIDFDLSRNVINDLQLGLFDPLQKLVNLDLSGNALMGSNINPYLFDRSRKIKSLKFSRNNMDNAAGNLLHALTELQELEFEECELNEVPSFLNTRKSIKLKILNLSGNRIKDIKNATFDNLTGLLALNLSGNAIENIEENAFKQLIKLKVIVLRNNLIKELPESLFQSMNALSNADLANNLIEYVPVNAFRGTKLKNLNLSHNKFTYLQDNFCLELRNSGTVLTKFYFNDNPWQCACLKDILNEVTKYNIMYNSAKYDGKHPVCVVGDHNICQRRRSFTEFIDLYETIMRS